MENKITVLLTIISIFSCVQTKKLPSYMKQCRISDPNRDECGKTAANDALPYIVDGVKELKIPSVKPLHINRIETQQGPNFKIIMENINATGLERSHVDSIKLDYENKFWKINVSVPVLSLLFDYNMDGKILFVPLKGTGWANYTLVDGLYSFYMKFDVKPLKKGGKDHLVVTDNTVDITLKKTVGRFDNLFNGDKKLGDQMNFFLNENWRQVWPEFKPTVEETMSQVTLSMFNGIFSTIPFEEIALP